MLKQLLGRRAPGKQPAEPPFAARVDELYALATQAIEESRLEAAEKLILEALALDSCLPTLHYVLGMIELERGRYAKAIEALERALALAPAQGLPLVPNAEANAALARARLDMEQGIRPLIEPSYAGPAPCVSVIICSATPSKYEKVCANYRQLLAAVPHEIVGIHDASSMCQGYRRALERARGEILVFCHDDIIIQAPDFADRLLNRLQRYELIGVVGMTRLSGSGWLYARWPGAHGQVGMPAAEGVTVTPYHMRGQVTVNAQVLDGLFFACRRELADDLGFDEQRFDGWHLYDFDFSYRAWRAGRRTAVCHDLLVVHESQGGFGAQWLRYAERFADKHPETKGFFSDRETPQLRALAIRSVDEWRLFTQHICARQDAQ